jgi:hypothetical protein
MIVVSGGTTVPGTAAGSELLIMSDRVPKIVGSGRVAASDAVAGPGTSIMKVAGGEDRSGFQDRRFGTGSGAGRRCRARNVDHDRGGTGTGRAAAKIVG